MTNSNLAALPDLAYTERWIARQHADATEAKRLADEQYESLRADQIGTILDDRDHMNLLRETVIVATPVGAITLPAWDAGEIAICFAVKYGVPIRFISPTKWEVLMERWPSETAETAHTV